MNLGKFTFNKDEVAFVVELNADEATLVVDQVVSFDVAATVIKSGYDPYTRSLGVEIDFREQKGRIKPPGSPKSIFEFDLADLRVRADGSGYEWFAEDNDSAFDTVSDGINQTSKEFFQDVPFPLPVGDPIFGCLLKAGVTSAIGQAVACRESIGPSLVDGQPPSERFGLWYQCLRGHIGGFYRSTVRRFLRCALTAGVL